MAIAVRVGLYHLIVVVSSSITNARFPMLTSPKHFTTQRQIWGHTLQAHSHILLTNTELPVVLLWKKKNLTHFIHRSATVLKQIFRVPKFSKKFKKKTVYGPQI